MDKVNLRLIHSKQQGVYFSYCPHPVTIDKSKDWGEGNKQCFPKGVFFKHDENDANVVTHGVQPNEEGTAPVGWIKDYLGTFEKKPILIGETLQPGQTKEINTLDGLINYEVKVTSVMCYNRNEDGSADMNDVYVQSLENLEKNYYLG